MNRAASYLMPALITLSVCDTRRAVTWATGGRQEACISALVSRVPAIVILLSVIALLANAWLVLCSSTIFIMR